MIDSQLIKNIILVLEPQTRKLNRSIDEITELPKRFSLTHLTNICLRLRDAYCFPESLTTSELLKLRKDVYLAKHEMKQNPTKYTRQKYLSLSKKLEEQQSIDALDQVLLISDEMPDILNLLTFTNIFNIMAHLEKAPPNIRNTCYGIKDNLLEHLVNLTKNKKNIGSIVVPSATQNARNVFYLWIEGIGGTKMFAWHSKSLPLTASSDFSGPLPYSVSHKKIEDITESDMSLYYEDILGNTQNLSQMWTYSSKDEQRNKINELLTTEFIGGGTYGPSQNIPADNRVTERTENEIVQAINNSENDEIKKLMSLTAHVQPRYTFDVNKMIAAEVIQTAFNANIIIKSELEKMHLKIFDSLLRTSNRPDLAELKSCGKNGEKKQLVLHVQKNYASKPLIWDISSETFKTLSEKYSGKEKSKITLTSGKYVAQKDNISVLNTVAEEQLNYTAQKLNSFLSGPKAKKWLKHAAKNADPATKALIASIICEFIPKKHQIKKTKSKRNGGPAYE